MPKIEPKQVQSELESGNAYGLYWIFGPERLKVSELVKRIQKTFLADIEDASLSIEKIDGDKNDSSVLLDLAQGMGLFGGGKKLILVFNADGLKSLESLLGAFPGKSKVSELETIVVCMSDGFDGRLKALKKIAEEYAVVDCAAVAEKERETWIQYLAQRRKIRLLPDQVQVLRAVDPWSLEIIEQEMIKLEIAETDDRNSILSGGGSIQLRDRLIDAIFTRDSKTALPLIKEMIEQSEILFPFVGLLSWNARQLQQFLLEEKKGTSLTKRNPYLQKNLDRWKKYWNLESLNDWVQELYFTELSQKSTKQTALGIWSNLAIQTQGSEGKGNSKI